MLTSYQDTVRSLLDQHDIPGVSAEELEFFKSQFRASAFTCRLKSCPRATLGFESEKLRLQHEMTHVRRFRCTFADCKFPPFMSAQALKSHASKYHSHDPPSKSIRSIQVSPRAVRAPAPRGGPSDPQQNRKMPQRASQMGQESQEQSDSSSIDENTSFGYLQTSAASPTPPIVSLYDKNLPLGGFSTLDPREQQHASPVLKEVPANLDPLFMVRGGATYQLSPDDNANFCEIDKDGEEKVLPNGKLTGGYRNYFCRTFSVLNKGSTNFMLGDECARMLGYQVGELMSVKYRHIIWLLVNRSEINYPIGQEAFFDSLNDQNIIIMTARSMFSQFGYRVIKGGQPVYDDYWVAKSRKIWQEQDRKEAGEYFWTLAEAQTLLQVNTVLQTQVVDLARGFYNQRMMLEAAHFGGPEFIGDYRLKSMKDISFIDAFQNSIQDESSPKL